jgi:hypothetical protein
MLFVFSSFTEKKAHAKELFQIADKEKSISSQFQRHQFMIHFSSDTTTNDTIYTFATEMPQYPGGDHALQVFFLNNIHWPDVLDNGDEIPSTFFLSWVVEKDGSVSDPEVKSPSHLPLSKELEQAIIKAITKLSVFIPAKMNGAPVRFRFKAPIRIDLKD